MKFAMELNDDAPPTYLPDGRVRARFMTSPEWATSDTWGWSGWLEREQIERIKAICRERERVC